MDHIVDGKVIGSATMTLTAARAAIVAIITYQVMLIVLIFIRPDLDPSWHTISEWAIGPHGWIMSLAFLISAASYGSLFVAIRPEVRALSGKIGLGLLLICAIGTVGVGMFRTDPMPFTSLSTVGALHVLSGTSALILLPLAALFINLNLALKNSAWSGSRRVLLWTAGLPMLGFLGFITHAILFVMPRGANAYGPGVPLGWPPRLLLLTYMVWLITLASQAIKVRNSQP